MIIRDGEWTLVQSDLKLGRFVWSRQNPDGSTTYRTDYRMDEVIQDAKALRNETQNERYGDWRKIASVPLSVHYGALAEANHQRDDKYIDRWLGENSAFKTFR